jgi:predicted unusual protein kinase regulating ubiquinone biosynthesis (AarF/ABC1/UbiB family)
MLKARNLGAYRDMLVLFTRYGRKDFRVELDAAEPVASELEEHPVEPDVMARANAFANALKEMGPTYVKFGQLLSTRPDIVPPEYIQALEALQDDLEPFSFAEVERIVEEDLGVRMSKAFQYFESTPVAAASLGQVHRAVLRDGRDVVVKVQRPNVRDRVRRDLEVFTEIAGELEGHTQIARKLNLVSAIEQARRVMLAELDYLQEARNTRTLSRNLEQFPEIYVPEVIDDYTSPRVLTTELVRGRKVSKLTPLALIESDYAELAAVLTRAYLKQICVDGIWHSDPHPGNVFISETIDGQNGARLVLLDFGMVSRISEEFQDEVVKLLLAVSSNKGRDAADACVRMSEMEESFDRAKFEKEIANVVASVHDAAARDINTGQLIFRLIGIANDNDLRVPSELAMLAKTLLHLDAITRKLDPEYDPKKVIRDYAEELMSQKLVQKFNPRNFYPALLDLNQLAVDLPNRVREIVDATAGGHLSFGVKLTQAEQFLGGIHKIANRITVGVIIAALLVSSSLMARVPTTFTIFGYPAIAVFGYVLASVAAFYLVISTLLKDRKDQEQARFKAK